MISGEDIAILIENPHTSGSDQLSNIEALLEKYPYCSSLYHIALKGAANSGSVEFEDKLKIAAAHVSDREHLYRLINDQTPVDLSEPLEEISSETEFIEEPEQIDLEQTNEITKEILVEAPENEVSVKEISETELESESAKESLIQEKEDELVSEQEPVDSELDADILSHAISIAFEHSAETAIPEKEKKDKVDEKPTLSQSTEKLENETLETTQEANIDDGKDLTFIDWLQAKQAKLHKTASNKTKSVSSEKSAPLKMEIKESSKSEINDLLDKFIAEEPSISKMTKEFYSPSANAKKSLEESSEIVSETLAKIHVMQGNYSKAIAAYKQLSLLYPEKNSFFATQIEKIKQKQSQ